VIRRLLVIYPRAWRDRYGDELEDLVESTGLTPSAVVDLVGSAIAEHLRTASRRMAGGPSMTLDRPGWGSRALAIAGLVALLPTLLFMTFSILIYNLNVPLESIRGVIDVAVGIGPVDIAFAAMPFVALALAAAPLLRVSVAGDANPRELVARVAVRPLRPRMANVIVAGLALAAILVLAVYGVTENVF
jgi:hypothetical protein